MAQHSRSNSFPSRSHPLTSDVDEHLSRLASSESASISSSALSLKLNGLQDLHDCIEKLLQLPLNQQALGLEQNQKYVDELLDGSIRLFDVCAIVKDSLLQTKECTQELQSVLRRRQGTEITYEVRKYLASRKAVKKAVLKALKNLKIKQNKYSETRAIMNILQEAQVVTLNVMESLLHFISGSEGRSKTSRLEKMPYNGRQVREKQYQLRNTFLFLHKETMAIVPPNTQTKECTQELQSTLHRRRGDEMRLVNNVRKYIKLRKVVKKAVHKALKSLKQNSSLNKDSEMETIFGTLQEVPAATMIVLETLLSFISEKEAESKFSSWSLVSKLIHNKRVGGEEGEYENEIANAEAAVVSLLSCKTSKSENLAHIEAAQL
ncbi:hypothetical protein SLEP1_g33591 [Rubroshorea leprosula]|uniref:Uncharacterized protein n=1 Tax=Rubroshorea leprosula TaxID=152421 RepID=A0AAV5KH45_9ROSI|nr:hypothetical protein SLEP1_g33591 [Rubroshorea leprosula]